MMNWCSKHECFEICPECMRESQLLVKPLGAVTTAATSRGARSTEDAGRPQPGDRIVYSRQSPPSKRGEYLGQYVRKLKGDCCRIQLEYESWPTDTKDQFVRLAHQASNGESK